jgi:hypothetical protein
VTSQTTVTVGVGVPVTTQNFSLVVSKPYTIKGKITDASSSLPLAGASITLNQNVPVPGNILATTDANGLYTFSRDPFGYTGPWTFTANAAGHASSSVTTTIPNGATTTENFILLPLGAITGLITDGNMTPVAGATVAMGLVSTQSDATGHYTLTGLTPGVGNVTVTAGGFDVATISALVLSGVTGTLNVALVKGSGVITGTATDDLGTPVPGATVVVGQVLTTTDANGSYTVSGIPAGQVKVTASAPRSQTQSSVVQISDHQTIEVDFQLSRQQLPLPRPSPVGTGTHTLS